MDFTTAAIKASTQSLLDALGYLNAIRVAGAEHPLIDGETSGESDTVQHLRGIILDHLRYLFPEDEYDRAVDAFHIMDHYAGRHDGLAALIERVKRS